MKARSNCAPTLKLYYSIPNPFHVLARGGMARIRFAWATPPLDEMKLTIHDSAGRPIRLLTYGVLKAGIHEVFWNGKDEEGKTVLPGKYWYRITTSNRMFSKMMTVVR